MAATEELSPTLIMVDGRMQGVGGRPQAQHQRQEEAGKDWWSRVKVGIRGSAHPEAGTQTLRLSKLGLFLQ